MRVDPQPLPRYYYLLIVEPGPCWTRLLFDQVLLLYDPLSMYVLALKVFEVLTFQ
jgi:hypothetical protein